MYALGRLPAQTATTIAASYTIPSFEAAVELCLRFSLHAPAQAPHAVIITLQPEALRFTLVDDGPGLSPAAFCSALLPSAPQPNLSALAGTSTIELRVRTSKFAALQTVRAGRPLETRRVPPERSHTLLPTPGLQVDVWETFGATPVRQRIERARPPGEVETAVRAALMPLALANPRVSVTVRVASCTLLATVRAPRLALSNVRAVLDDPRAHPWLAVPTLRARLAYISAAVSTPGLHRASVQLVAIDGVPLERSALHDVFARAWRAAVPLAVRAKRHPGFVVVVDTGLRGSREAALRHPLAQSGTLTDKRLEQQILLAVRRVLKEEEEGAVTETRTTLPPDQLIAPVEKAERAPKGATTSEEPEQHRQKLTSPEGELERPMPKRARFDDADMRIRPDIRQTEVEGMHIVHSAPSSTSPSVLSSPRPFAPRKTLWRAQLGVQSPCSNRLTSVKGEMDPECVTRALEQEQPGWCKPCFVRQKLGQPTQGQRREDLSLNTRRVGVSKATLRHMRVVGQADSKFIMTMNEKQSTLYAMDQHAVSERILYERLLRQAARDGVRSFALPTGERTRVSRSQRAILTDKCARIERWGWRFEFAPQAAVKNADTGTDADTVVVTHVPKVAGLNITDVIMGDPADLLAYADDLADGAISTAVPVVIMNVMASVACHSAVRFGDSLSRQQCESMVLEGLEQCDNPFACAHGRPSIVPVAVFR